MIDIPIGGHDSHKPVFQSLDALRGNAAVIML
jgi:hypothetical protein